MMNFLIYHSQILFEELVHEVVIEQKAFPEELFRQLYEIVFNYVEREFSDYNKYIKMQKKYFI